METSDPLEALDVVIDWELLRKALKKAGRTDGKGGLLRSTRF